MYETDASQKSELNSASGSGINSAIRTAMWHGNGGAELAIVPVLFALMGLVLDSALDTRPVFTVIGAIIGLAGAAFNQYFRYTQRMAKLTAERKAAHEARYGTNSGTKFTMTESIDLPTYVVASEVDDRKSENA